MTKNMAKLKMKYIITLILKKKMMRLFIDLYSTISAQETTQTSKK